MAYGTNEVEIVVKATDRTHEGFRAAESSGSSLGKTLMGVGKIAGGFLAGAAVIGGVTKFAGALSNCVTEARASARVTALTAQVIKTTGGAARVTAKQVGDLASAISRKTGVDDEAIQSGQNLLLTFTNVQNRVGKGNDIFNQATQAITDMSAALGQDMKTSAIQLGKALNDPIKGVSALQRVGVTFTEEQKKSIETFMKHGEVAKAQGVILKELGKEFGGAAAAMTTPADKLKVTIGNLREEIGAKLIPYVDKAAIWLGKNLPRAFDYLAPKVKALANWVSGDLVPAVRSAVRDALPKFKEALGYLKQAFGDSAVDGKKWGDRIVTVTTTVIDIVAYMAPIVAEHIRNIVIGIKVLWNAFRTTANIALDMAEGVVGAVGGIIGAMAKIPGKVGQPFRDALPGIKKAKEELQRVRDALNGIHGKTVWVDVKIRGANGRAIRSDLAKNVGGGGFAHGGVIGTAATGGVRNGLTLVGEHGAELIDAPAGTRVHSNPDTMRMLSQGKGGGPSTIQFVSDGTRTADFLLEMMRNAIRVRGGNVQAVLGR